MDFLGEVGGVFEFLSQWASLMIGTYLAFNTRLENIKLLYSCKVDD